MQLTAHTSTRSLSASALRAPRARPVGPRATGTDGTGSVSRMKSVVISCGVAPSGAPSVAHIHTHTHVLSVLCMYVTLSTFSTFSSLEIRTRNLRPPLLWVQGALRTDTELSVNACGRLSVCLPVCLPACLSCSGPAHAPPHGRTERNHAPNATVNVQRTYHQARARAFSCLITAMKRKRKGCCDPRTHQRNARRLAFALKREVGLAVFIHDVHYSRLALAHGAVLVRIQRALQCGSQAILPQRRRRDACN